MKFIQIREGFYIRKDSIEAIRDGSTLSSFSSTVHTKGGGEYKSFLNYSALLKLLEEDEPKVNQYEQFNAA